MDYNLTDEQKNVTLEYVLNQPVKAVENFDLTKRAIKYSTLIKGKKINEIKGDEEITRACILTKLTNEYGYALEDIELEHEYTAGRPHTNTSIIDVIVRDKKGDAFLFMELKSPDAYTNEDKDKIIEEQLFKVAAMEQAEGHFVKYLVLYTISVLGNEIKDDCIIIDHEKYITYKDWEVERDYANEIPVKYGKAQKIPYIKGSAKDLETHFTNEMLTSLQNDLHNVLWGGGGTGDKKKLEKSFLFGNKKNSENLFIERYYQLLKEGGRLAAVLPESVYDTTENKYIRLFIYKYFNVKAVVSLPQSTFAPFTNTKTSILFAQKKNTTQIEKWNATWEKYSKEWAHIKTRVENIVLVTDGKKQKDKLPSIKNLSEKEERELLDRLLKGYVQTSDKKFSNTELIEKYRNEIEGLCKFDKDTKDVFGMVNTWWVFGEVSKELDYHIFNAEVENIGYKRTKRGIKVQANDLYRETSEGEIIVDDGKMESILDYMREIDWSEEV